MNVNGMDPSRPMLWADVTGHTDASAATPATSNETNSLANKDVFMKLLVAQLKNQNPLNPADGVEFLSQLTQFSQLEQTIGSRQALETIRDELSKPAEATTSATSGAA